MRANNYNPGNYVTIMPFYPTVRLDNISFVRNGTGILYGINLLIKDHQHWAIIGQNGSGKTSLISIISGYHQPSEGKAEVLGKKFGSSDLRDLRLQIGECSSEIRDMIHKWEKVKDIVLSGRFASIGLYKTPSSRDNRRADHLLLSFGLTDRADHPFETLSEGEKQKTLLVRALMPEPDLLVLDEPCAGLDLTAREGLLDAVQEMCVTNGGPTLIYVTHHIEEIIPGITHAMALRKGRVIACGKRKDVLTDEVLSETFEVPVKLHEREGRLWPMILKC